MALRSVVLVPPAGAGGPRHTVVLRPGGPRDKGRAADVIAGVVGAILLLSCILLVQVLPHKDYLMPQFKVSFPDTLHDADFPTQKFNFTEAEGSRVHEFSFLLPDNTQSLTLVAFFADDDAPASLPDQFRIELFDPAHQPVLKTDVVNADPQQNSSNPANAFQFTPGQYSGRIPYGVGPHPSDTVVQGLARNEVKEQALARLEPTTRIHSAGNWIVRVTLINAQDCPGPTPGEPPSPQVVFCRAPGNGPQDGQDPGNPFSLNIAFTTYKADIEQLS